MKKKLVNRSILLNLVSYYALSTVCFAEIQFCVFRYTVHKTIGFTVAGRYGGPVQATNHLRPNNFVEHKETL